MDDRSHKMHFGQELSEASETMSANTLVHAYFDIDLAIVWDTVTKDLAPLITELENIVRSEEK